MFYANECKNVLTLMVQDLASTKAMSLVCSFSPILILLVANERILYMVPNIVVRKGPPRSCLLETNNRYFQLK